MALTLPKPPEEGRDIVRTALGSLISSPSGNAAYEMEKGGSETLDLTAPHKIFFVGLKDVAKGHVLSAAKFVGWRYIIVRGESPLAAAELGVDELGGGLEFSQINHGPFVGSTVRGVSVAEELDSVRTNNYEPRLLKIPALYIIALWLHSYSEPDMLIPLPPTRPELTAYVPYAESDFSSILRGVAVKKLEFKEE
jgi:hypothetical protein